MLKNFVIHGVGEVTFYDFNDGREVLRLRRQETAAWTLAYDEQDVYGGDNLDIFENFETGRTQTVSFENNEFDLRMLEASTGKRPVDSYSAPIVNFSEGVVLDATTYTLINSATADDSTVRIRYADTREDLAPVPNNFTTANLEEVAGATFTLADSVVVRITAVVNGVESVASATATIVIVAATGDVEVTLPSYVLDIPSGLPAYDVDEDGFYIYIDVNAAGEYQAVASLSAAGSVVTLPASPGSGIMIPPVAPTVAGQYTVSSGVITFSAAEDGAGLLIDYVWTTSSTIYEASIVDVLSTCLRRYMKAIWRCRFQTKDGTVMGLQAFIYKMKYTGDFTLDFNRADASSHSLEFKIFDPERADNKIVRFTQFDLGEVEPCA